MDIIFYELKSEQTWSIEIAFKRKKSYSSICLGEGTRNAEPDSLRNRLVNLLERDTTNIVKVPKNEWLAIISDDFFRSVDSKRFQGAWTFKPGCCALNALFGGEELKEPMVRVLMVLNLCGSYHYFDFKLEHSIADHFINMPCGDEKRMDWFGPRSLKLLKHHVHPSPDEQRLWHNITEVWSFKPIRIPQKVGTGMFAG